MILIESKWKCWSTNYVCSLLYQILNFISLLLTKDIKDDILPLIEKDDTCL